MKPSTDDIHVIDVHYQRSRMAAAHLLVSGGEAAFIDVGTTLSHDYLHKGLKKAGVSPDALRYIILTHIHLDHAGAAGVLMRSCPHATLLVHPRGAPHIIDPQRLIQASIDIYGADYFKRLYGEIVGVPEERVRRVEDGFMLDFNGRTLQFFDTPGHARHHCTIWDPHSGGLFTGDTMGIAYPELQEAGKPPFLFPTTSPAAFEPDILESSITRLMKMRPRRFYLTHYGPVAAAQESVDRLIELIRRHAALAQSETAADGASIAGCVHDMIWDAYCDYADDPIAIEQFDNLLAGDIALNSEGIVVYGARLRHKSDG